MEPTVDVELRIVEVKGALDVGLAEIKGDLKLLVQGAENDRLRVVDQEERVRAALMQVAADRKADQAARAATEEDNEDRLRLVDPLPLKVTALELAHQAIDTRVDTLDQKIARAVGVAIGVSGALSGASALVVWALNHH